MSKEIVRRNQAQSRIRRRQLLRIVVAAIATAAALGWAVILLT